MNAKTIVKNEWEAVESKFTLLKMVCNIPHILYYKQRIQKEVFTLKITSCQALHRPYWFQQSKCNDHYNDHAVSTSVDL